MDYDDLILTACDLLQRPGISPWVLFKLDAGVAVLTLNRPDHRNAIDIETVGELTALLDRCRDDDAIRVIVLTGSGTCFCLWGPRARDIEHGRVSLLKALDELEGESYL